MSEEYNTVLTCGTKLTSNKNVYSQLLTPCLFYIILCSGFPLSTLPTVFTFSDDNSMDISSDVQQFSSNIEVDLETGEMIDNNLKHYFGFSSFRPLQRETIVSTMNKNDRMTVVGTGGGKSLTYLLPSVLSSKSTLVISPASRCQNLNISACMFTGDFTKQMQDS